MKGLNQLCHVILLALKYKMNGSKNICSNNELKKIVGKNIFEEVNQPGKFKFIIDQQYFFNMCYHITMILAKFGYFLRVYELKKKYRHLFMKKNRYIKNCKHNYPVVSLNNIMVLQSFALNMKDRKEKASHQLISFTSQQKT